MVSRMAAKRFTVDLRREVTTGTSFRIPFDLKEALGRARPPVTVTISDHTWRTTPGVYDGVGYVVVNRALEAATGVDEAKRPETRERRIHGTLERMREGRALR